MKRIILVNAHNITSPLYKELETYKDDIYLVDERLDFAYKENKYIDLGKITLIIKGDKKYEAAQKRMTQKDIPEKWVFGYIE